MDKEKKINGIKLFERIIILSLGAIITLNVVFVLLFLYRPNNNALGALGTVCLDVISIIVILAFAINIVFGRIDINKTNKLFLWLLVGTMVAIFLDFMVWSSDGSLQYVNITYAFTIASLCGGSVLACLFCLYFTNYLAEMHGLVAAVKQGRVLACLNIVASFLSLILALTKTAFVFVDGHYQTGELYDIVTLIPILTLIYLTIYSIAHVKKIGVHDVLAVIGYILIMITGALIESVYRIGTTYVAITIANIVIYIMLQNKFIVREQKKQELLFKRINNQYDILKSMADIYTYVNFIDFDDNSFIRFEVNNSTNNKKYLNGSTHSELNAILSEGMVDEVKQAFWSYTDLSTLSERMTGEKIISGEFLNKEDGWLRAEYIRIGDNVNEPVRKVIYAIRNIDEEKKNVEKWIYRSNTDELTGLMNRRAYVDEIAKLNTTTLNDDFVYISLDSNGLKVVNDTLGHMAGDELIIGTSECLKKSLGKYGKLFRTGGDEFVALVNADDSQLKNALKELKNLTENFKGELVDNITVSCGYVKLNETAGMSLHQMAVLADKRMYEDKSRYYQQKGVDRRGQRDAHVALSTLYSKILKINITEDVYQIINMDVDEKELDKEFSNVLSVWMKEYREKGFIYPDDLNRVKEKTDLEYLKQYFKAGNKLLTVSYRRKYLDGYYNSVMKIIPANDYSDNSQNLYLYVERTEF